MPHIRLEYSTNIRESIKPEELFSSCHRILIDTVDADLFRCQSRAIPCDLFHVGKGFEHEAFVYLEILLLEGRSLSKKQERGKQILKLLEKYFALSLKKLNLQIAVHILEISPSHYFKAETSISD